MRNHVGQIDDTGTVTFQNVPPGHYVLDAKLFPPDPNPGTFDFPQPIGSFSTRVIVKPQSENPQAILMLGTFAIEQE